MTLSAQEKVGFGLAGGLVCLVAYAATQAGHPLAPLTSAGSSTTLARSFYSAPPGFVEEARNGNDVFACGMALLHAPETESADAKMPYPDWHVARKGRHLLACGVKHPQLGWGNLIVRVKCRDTKSARCFVPSGLHFGGASKP